MAFVRHVAKWTVWVFVMVVCGITLGAKARAQSGDSGAITGYVFDQQGSPLRGVKISASSPTQIGGVRNTYSNDEGFFRFPQLTPGTFDVKASAPKLRSIVQKDVRVGIGAPAELTLIMDVETAEETVRVIDRAPLISTTKANIKETFDLDFVELLPHGNRDNIHQQMVNSIPGAVDGRVRGGAQNQTRFTQDGFDMRGQYPTLKSSAAFEIQHGGYGADDATASGGLVNLVTKSGSNKFEFEFNATADSSHLRFFQDPGEGRNASYQYIINPTLSGPIIRDRLWFHFNAESHIQQDSRDPSVETYLPDPPVFRKFIQKGTLKLTWQVTPRNKLTSLNNFDFPYEENRKGSLGVDSTAQEFRQGQRYFAGLIWESLLTDSLVLRAQGGYIAIPQHVYPATCRWDPENCDWIPAVVQKYPRRLEYQNSANHSRDDLYSLQFNTRLEWFKNTKNFGDHNVTLKNNFFSEEDIRRTSKPGDSVTEWNGTVPERQITYYSNDPRVSDARYGWFISSTNVQRNQATVSDQWRVTRHLTLTPALSHIFSTASNSNGDNLAATTTWAPSITGAWDATRDGKTVIRGGFSTYVDVDMAAFARHTVGSQTSRTCKWDDKTGTFTKECSYSGGLSKNTYGLPCGPTGYRVDGTDCYEALTIPRTWEYTAGAQREVVQGVALSLDLVYRDFKNQYENRETNRVWLPSGEELDPVAAYRNGRSETITDLGTPDGARRRYIGVTAGVVKREGRFRIQSYYTWSQLRGNVFDGRNNLWGDIPGRDPYLDGYLPGDYRHQLKTTATYHLASWASMGLRYTYLSGQPYNRFFRNEETGSFESLRAQVGYNPGANINDPGDDRPLREPDTQDVNVQFRVNWMPLIGQQLDTYVDVLNALALRTATSLGQEDGRNFGLVQGRMSPFRIRIGLNYRY